jgi:hypothetical protein
VRRGTLTLAESAFGVRVFRRISIFSRNGLSATRGRRVLKVLLEGVLQGGTSRWIAILPRQVEQRSRSLDKSVPSPSRPLYSR